MEAQRLLLIHVTGPDRPGLTSGILRVLADADALIIDIEQIVTRDRISLELFVGISENQSVFKDLLFFGWENDLSVDFEFVEGEKPSDAQSRFAITVLAPTLSAEALSGVTTAIAAGGSNIDRIARLSREPVVSYEMVTSGGDLEVLRQNLLTAAADHHIDVAIQKEGLGRRAKRLVVIDVDSTLIQDEVIDLLAAAAGAAEEVKAITEQAMSGEIDFETALRTRVKRLAGLTSDQIDEAVGAVRLTPGARTFVRTLHRLGFIVAAVSGGFTVFTDRLRADLGLDHVYANELVTEGGVLTGELTGTVVDRGRKAELLAEIAAREGIPVEQTVAIGDGANDLDMLSAAGLGIAFNAKPAVREAADTSVSVPYLDAILFVLGIRRDDILRADAEDPLL